MNSPLILDGRMLAQELRTQITAQVAGLVAERGSPPALAVIHVEGDDASARYVRSLHRACDQVGMEFHYSPLPASCRQVDLEARLDALSATATIDGLLIQMPLPADLDSAAAVLHLDHHKDVDGVHPISAGRLQQSHPTMVPNTPAGGLALLRRYGINVAGMHAVVVGRSAIVGKPMATLLLNANATVTVCHRQTRDLASVVRSADLVVAAAGVAGLVTGEMLKPGAVVVDFGINSAPGGGICGDVAFESACALASAITPVPGGTGPVTTMMLLQNVLNAATGRINQRV